MMKPGQVDHFCSAGTEHYNKSHLNTVQVQTKIYLSKRRPSNRCCCKLLLLVASLGWNSQGEWQKMIIEAWSQQTRINKFNLLKCRSHCFTIGSQVTADELATKLSWVSSLILSYRTVAYHSLGHWMRKTLPFLFFTCVSTQCSVELSSERFCLLERKRS